jgi:hypothetical protein
MLVCHFLTSRGSNLTHQLAASVWVVSPHLGRMMGSEDSSGIVISFFTGLDDLFAFPLRDFCRATCMEVVQDAQD